jgi:arginine/lysine/ornithine decarboxylase
MLEALADYHARDRYGFTPPGYRQGRGADPRAVTVIGQDAFRSDLLATACGVPECVLNARRLDVGASP